MKSVIFGHSHVWPIKKAIQSGLYSASRDDYSVEVALCGTKDFPGPLISYDLAGAMHLNSCVAAFIQKMSLEELATTNLVSVVQGNYYNIVGLTELEEPFDFVVPGCEQIELVSSRQLLSYDIVTEMIASHTRELIEFLKLLKKLSSNSVFHVNSPPPIESNHFINEDLSSKKIYSGQTSVIAPASVRLKLWLTQKNIIESICRKLDVVFVGAPTDTITNDGFLEQKYWKDSVHANEHYANLLLEEVERETTKAMG